MHKNGLHEPVKSLELAFGPASTEEDKKQLISSYMKASTLRTEDLRILLFKVLDLPSELHERTHLVEFIVNSLPKPLSASRSALDKALITEIIQREHQLEIIALLLSKFRDNSYGYDSSVEKLEKDLMFKLRKSSCPLEKHFKCNIVNDMMIFKEQHPSQPFILKDFDYEYTKYCITIIFTHLFHPSKSFFEDLEFDQSITIFFKWLMILSPAADRNDYEFAKTICTFMFTKCKVYRSIDERKLKEVFVNSFNLLKFRYFPEDTLRGQSNIVLFYDFIQEERDIERTIQTYFADIIRVMDFEVEPVIHTFTNIIQMGVTYKNSSIISIISQMYQANKAFELLYKVFQKVIVEYFVQKIHVLRGFEHNIGLLTLYFYGFAEIYEITQAVIQKFIYSLRFIVRTAIKTKKKDNLSSYLDFLDCIVNLYSRPQSPSANALSELREIIHGVRKELDLVRDSRYMDVCYKKSRQYVWKIDPDEIRATTQMPALEMLIIRYPTDYSHKGLKNLGNTCYMNSAMIALFSTGKFRDRILKLPKDDLEKTVDLQTSGKKHDKMNIEASPLKELYYLFQDLKHTKEEAVDPKYFRETLPLRFKNSNTEEDSSEFFREYLDLLEKSLKKTAEKDLVDECFGGEIVHTVTCDKCKKPQTTKEKIIDLTVSFGPQGRDPQTQNYDLVKMIRANFETECFEQQNKYKCEICNEYSELATKTPTLQTIPEFLLVTLNRFYFDPKTNMRGKVCDLVHLHNHLDFSEIFPNSFRQGTHRYSLYSMIIHSGLTTESGHYYTLLKEDRPSLFWILYNDSCVLRVPDDEISKIFEQFPQDTAYMLFYKRLQSKEQF